MGLTLNNWQLLVLWWGLCPAGMSTQMLEILQMWTLEKLLNLQKNMMRFPQPCISDPEVVTLWSLYQSIWRRVALRALTWIWMNSCLLSLRRSQNTSQWVLLRTLFIVWFVVYFWRQKVKCAFILSSFIQCLGLIGVWYVWILSTTPMICQVIQPTHMLWRWWSVGTVLTEPPQRHGCDYMFEFILPVWDVIFVLRPSHTNVL